MGAIPDQTQPGAKGEGVIMTESRGAVLLVEWSGSTCLAATASELDFSEVVAKISLYSFLLGASTVFQKTLSLTDC